MELDELATIAQRYVADVPVILLGTGATIPLGIPGMGPLAQAIQKQLTYNSAEEEKLVHALHAELTVNPNLETALHHIALTPALVNQVVRITCDLPP